MRSRIYGGVFMALISHYPLNGTGEDIFPNITEWMKIMIIHMGYERRNDNEWVNTSL